MAPLSNDTVRAVLDTAIELHRERRQIADLLAGLPTSFGAVRYALNELQRIVSA